jgi:hypothetical protein
VIEKGEDVEMVDGLWIKYGNACIMRVICEDLVAISRCFSLLAQTPMTIVLPFTSYRSLSEHRQETLDPTPRFALLVLSSSNLSGLCEMYFDSTTS